MTKRFTGYHMLAILVAFFGVVIGVNMLMAVLAVRTFGGTVVDNSYVASQQFNHWLAEARRQNATGWKTEVELDSDRRVSVSGARNGQPVAHARLVGFAEHPLGRVADIPLHFVELGNGRYRTVGALPRGRWTVHLSLRAGGVEARLLEHVA